MDSTILDSTIFPSEAVAQRCSVTKGVLKNFAKLTEKHLCQSLFFNKDVGLIPANFIKKETLSQLFSSQFRKVFKSTFLSRSYIKRFVWYNLYDSQSAFKFLWRLHYRGSRSYQVHKSCSYRLLRPQQFKENDLRTSCSSSKSRKKGKIRRVYVKPWLKKSKKRFYECLLKTLKKYFSW